MDINEGVLVMKFTLPILLVVCFAISSCEKELKEEAILLELFHKEKKLNCQLASMKDSITLEWDNTNRILEEHLPTSIPEEEKQNLLKVRNANLIRMFKTYDQLDATVKMEVKETEEIDKKMSQRINALKQESHKIESQKIQLLNKVNQSEGASELERLQEINQSIMSENCDQFVNAYF